MLYRGDGLDNEYFNKRMQEIKRIPLREIIEEFGGSFTSNTKFTHPFFNEKIQEALAILTGFFKQKQLTYAS